LSVVQTTIFNDPFTPAETPGQSTSLLLRPCTLTPVPDTLYFASTISHEAQARKGEGRLIVKRRLAVAAVTAARRTGLGPAVRRAHRRSTPRPAESAIVRQPAATARARRLHGLTTNGSTSPTTYASLRPQHVERRLRTAVVRAESHCGQELQELLIIHAVVPAEGLDVAG
jgi:hypothetical protein